MTTSGYSVQGKIRSKIKEIEEKHEVLAAIVNDTEKNIEDYVKEREDIYTKLSVVYLPEMTAQAVNNTLKEAQAEVRKIFQEKQEKRTQLETRIDDFRKDAETKLKDYRENKLFMYLTNRKFGTAKYDHDGIIKTLDEWVAR